MLEVPDSRQHVEELLREKRQNENVLRDKILNHEGTIKSLILELADSIAERYELLDPMLATEFALSQISTTISRLLAPNPIADFVRRCLPDKYKNANMQRAIITIDQLNNIIEHCGTNSRKYIEESSNLELESQIQFIKKAKNLGDDLITLLNNEEQKRLQEAINRGMGVIAGEKIRDQISERDYRYEIPDYFGLEELNKEVISQGNRWIKALDVFFNKKYPDRPGHIRQEVYKWANAIRVIANVHEVINEDKWSGDMSFWFDREYHANIQSKHDAGNSTFWPTSLCASCSKNVDEDPKDCVKMKYWRPSPTRHICPQCGGTKIKERENTREQVGDKEADVYRDAADVLNHIPFYADVFIQYVEGEKSPPIYSRKEAISGPFSKSAIGGVDKIVVPRNKNTKQ